jgi:prepilin-type N-terminal cleavage/methylation domain-containing protein
MKKRSKGFKGFTLIELIVVLAIIMLAFSFIVISTRNDEGVSLKSSQRILSSITQGVRGQAILKQTPARLIIYADKGEDREDDKYLRFFGIITQDPQDSSKWIAGTKGTYLPKGIYFMPKLSQIANGRDKRVGKMRLEYPRIRSKSGDPRMGEDYYFYEFNANGTTASKFVNAWLIFGAGVLKPDKNRQLDVSFDDPALSGLKSALIFRRVGSMSLITDSNQIDAVSQTKVKGSSIKE